MTYRKKFRCRSSGNTRQPSAPDAKLNGLDPALYLRTVLAQIPEHPINRIAKLLP